jgi:acyl-CoA synthetase (AMP-forming)/AMP-acid ligase II
MSKNVYDIIRHAARQWPDQPAIHDEFGTVTFSELFEETERLRLWLEERGVQP